MAGDIPAVVLGAGANGLGIARSLARAHVPVWLLDCAARRAEMHTRAAHCLPIAALHGEALIGALLRLRASRFAGLRPVLFLTQEEAVKTVSQHRDQLAECYRCNLPARDVVDALLQKHGFQRLAEHFGAPIPPLVHVASPADLPALERLNYPVVVKPDARHAEYARQFKKAYRMDNAPDTIALLRRILPVLPDVVVQEWIEGPDAAIYFCLQQRSVDGQVIASFTGRKIRSWPPHVGGTASCVAAPEVHAELDALTTRFFSDTGVTGMAGMEYKRDARSGAFRMVEPTIGRSDYQEEVATLNGVNLPYAAYCDALGYAFPAPCVASRAAVWRVRSEDIQSAAAQGQRLSQGYPPGARVVDAVWRWRDPMPFFVQFSRRVRHALFHRTASSARGSQAAGSQT